MYKRSWQTLPARSTQSGSDSGAKLGGISTRTPVKWSHKRGTFNTDLVSRLFLSLLLCLFPLPARSGYFLPATHSRKGDFLDLFGIFKKKSKNISLKVHVVSSAVIQHPYFDSFVPSVVLVPFFLFNLKS